MLNILNRVVRTAATAHIYHIYVLFRDTAACQQVHAISVLHYQSKSFLISSFLPLFQVLSAFQAQHTAAAAAAQPQLLIPLSSIPSYSAAMDTNPLLGSTYKKFPYPSMAEISSLAAQTQFTEEQIKVDESCFGQLCSQRMLCFFCRRQDNSPPASHVSPKIKFKLK